MHLIRLVSISVAIGGVPVSTFQLQSSIITSSSSRSTRTFHRVHVNTNEDAPRDIPTMDEWATTCGVQRAEGFQLTASEDPDGLGFDNVNVFAMTSVDIPTNSPLLYVPSEMILSSNRAASELRSTETEGVEKRILSSNAKDQLRQYYLMLKILVEYEKGEESPWFPWLNSLPRYFSNAASMTPFCYKCLPSLMAALSLKERANLNNLRVRQVPFLSDETKGNEDLWRWAYQIVYTRSFEVDGSKDLCIAPMADMFNHAAEADVQIAYDEDGNCHVQTIKDVPSGSPLRMCYADPTNPSFLFARYGFLDESSPATFCKMIPPHISDELRDMGYAHNRMLFYKDTGEVSQEVWDVLLFQLLGESDPSAQQQLYTAHTTGDYDTKQQMHEQNYQQTSSKLLEHIDTFLNQLSELSGKTQGLGIEEFPRLPLILRHNEFVKNTFLAVRACYFQ